MKTRSTEDETRLRDARQAMRAAAVLDAEGELESAERELGYARALYATILGRPEVPTTEPAAPTALSRRVRRSSAAARALDLEAERRIFGRSPVLVRARRGLPSVIVALLFVGAYFAFAVGLRPFARVHASGTFFSDPSFAGEKVFDGQLETEWLLPDRTAGHVDLLLFPAQDVRTIVVVNGHNRHFADRAARSFEVQLHRDGVMVHAERGSFRALTSPGERVEIRLPAPVHDVDHVRVVVHDHMGLGSALAEIILR